MEVVTVLLGRRGLEVASKEVFHGQRDGRWSFTDAAIVTVARRRQAEFIATFDADFRGIDGLGIVPG